MILACLCGARSDVDHWDRNSRVPCWACDDLMYPIDSGFQPIGELIEPIMDRIERMTERAA